jgi:glutathione S-transferase
MSLVRLYQFPISHYCEKVRWALDYKGIPHEINNLVPVWHVPTMLLLSRQTQVPVIEMEGRVIHGSTAILQSLEERFPAAPGLLPAGEGDRSKVDDIVELCDEKLGPHVRRACYYQVLKSSKLTYELLCDGQSTMRRIQLRASLPVVMKVMQKGMRIDNRGYLRSLDHINQTLDELEKLLGKRKVFVGHTLSAADIACASLLAPLARPAGTIYAKTIVLPEGFQELLDAFNDRPIMTWTRQLYAQYRQTHCISPRSRV